MYTDQGVFWGLHSSINIGIWCMIVVWSYPSQRPLLCKLCQVNWTHRITLLCFVLIRKQRWVLVHNPNGWAPKKVSNFKPCQREKYQKESNPGLQGPHLQNPHHPLCLRSTRNPEYITNALVLHVNLSSIYNREWGAWPQSVLYFFLFEI